MSEPIGVVGVGWVGLVTAACFAELGHRVVARDIVAEKVEALSGGEVPIHEPGLPELLERNRERLSFTTEMGELLDAARLIFVCVETPPTYSGDADLSAVTAVRRGDRRRRGPGAGDEEHRAGRHRAQDPPRRSRGLAYVSCPEFLSEGSAVQRLPRARPRRDRRRARVTSGRPTRSPQLYEPLGEPLSAPTSPARR